MAFGLKLVLFILEISLKSILNCNNYTLMHDDSCEQPANIMDEKWLLLLLLLLYSNRDLLREGSCFSLIKMIIKSGNKNIIVRDNNLNIIFFFHVRSSNSLFQNLVAGMWRRVRRSRRSRRSWRRSNAEVWVEAIASSYLSSQLLYLLEGNLICVVKFEENHTYPHGKHNTSAVVIRLMYRMFAYTVRKSTSANI